MVTLNDKGAALAILNLGAGGAAFIGPAIVTLFYPVGGGAAVAIAFCVLYVIVAVLSVVLKDASDPAERAAGSRRRRQLARSG
jgi:nitrate/nitrite transporter NarK